MKICPEMYGKSWGLQRDLSKKMCIRDSPRTDSQYITEDMEQSTMELLEVLPEILPFLEGNMGYDVGRIINNDKVSDHHALLPLSLIHI